MIAEQKRWRRRLAGKIVLSLVGTLLFFVVLELVLWVAHFEYKPRERKLWKPTVAGFVGTHEFYIQTEFAPPGYVWVSEPDTPYTDRYGFRKPGVPAMKAPGKIRVAFMGGSTTQGGYRPYPERAIRLINNAIQRDEYEMLNVSCSSYSLHQSLIALDRWILPRDPDIVVVYHGWNDQNVMDDGFSDREKDFLLKLGGSPSASGRFDWIRGLRTAQFVGRLVDVADVAWPRVRVSPGQFARGLREMTGKCAEQEVAVMIFTRPWSHKGPPDEKATPHFRHWAKRLGTNDAREIYTRIHDTYTTIQKDVAGEFDNAEVFDASVFVDELQKQNEQGAFGEGIEIFRNDACHLFEFAEQKLAEELALALAPEHEAAIRNYINSPGYHEALAREYLREEIPPEAIYHARCALAMAPEHADSLNALIAEASNNIEFVKLFREGRWAGLDRDYGSKIRKLKRCLALRPRDFGVCMQLYRVCIYTKHLEAAADAMAGFQPSTPQHRYQWLKFTFQSHLSGKRWRQARESAHEILRMNPSDREAVGFLQALRSSSS